MTTQRRPIAICDGCGEQREIVDVRSNWCDAC